jgi:hypothetical protein
LDYRTRVLGVLKAQENREHKKSSQKIRKHLQIQTKQEKGGGKEGRGRKATTMRYTPKRCN